MLLLWSSYGNNTHDLFCGKSSNVRKHGSRCTGTHLNVTVPDLLSVAAFHSPSLFLELISYSRFELRRRVEICVTMRTARDVQAADGYTDASTVQDVCEKFNDGSLDAAVSNRRILIIQFAAPFAV
jgi:hypothetical protein